METIEGPAVAAPGGAHAFETEDEEGEWAVIDNDLLAQALLPAAQEGGGNGENEASGADLIDAITQAPALELSRCSLHRINHLDGFRRLTRLRLDNNGIRAMENLEELVHLTWLDLSFNRIERISGLESLRKLTDLSLYHNRILDLQGLAHAGCRGLQYLSLGRNRLDLSAPASLLAPIAKRFPSLEALVLQGQQPQPGQGSASAEEAQDGGAAADPSAIQAAVVAVLPRLQYLDSTLLKQPTASGVGKDKGAGLGVVGA